MPSTDGHNTREYDGRAFARRSVGWKPEPHWKYWPPIKKYCHFWRVSKVLCGPDANLQSFFSLFDQRTLKEDIGFMHHKTNLGEETK